MQCSETRISQGGISSRLDTVEEASEREDMETEHSKINCGREKGWKGKMKSLRTVGTGPGSALSHIVEVSKGKREEMG